MSETLALLVLLFQSIPQGAAVNNVAVTTVATPTDSPGQGTYSSTQTVTLSDATGSAVICYTTDGGTPTATTPGTCDAVGNEATYSTGFSVAATATVKAIGTKTAMTNSGVLTSVYTITCTMSADLVGDNFDGGSTTCGDDILSQANCRNAWTVQNLGSGSITNVGTGLEGTNAKVITSASGNQLDSYVTFASSNSAYAFARFKATTLDETYATQRHLIFLSNSSGGSNQCELGIVYDGTSAKFVAFAGNAWQTAFSSPVLAAGTQYWVWLDFVKSTSCDIYISTTPTKPTVTGHYTTSINTFASTVLKLYSTLQTGVHATFNPTTWDRIRVNSTAPYGDDVADSCTF